MRVLVGCECSQVVTSAFRSLGHEAFSCDLVPSYGDLPEFHFQGDIREVFNFVKPDLFIAHPPCTFLSRVGSPHLYDSKGNVKDWLRFENALIARDFFLWCLSRDCDLAIENPIPIKRLGLPSSSQIIQPFHFGDPYTKATCLWLRGLPLLEFTKIVRPVGSWVKLHRSSRLRSETFPGIASAMAHQWGVDGVKPGFQFFLFNATCARRRIHGVSER